MIAGYKAHRESLKGDSFQPPTTVYEIDEPQVIEMQRYLHVRQGIN